jgi:preprotein translocase subunit SecG
MSHTKPSVIEPGMHYYMNYSLENSQMFKKKLFNKIFNISLFLFFILFFGGILYFSYKNRTPPELRDKLKREKTQKIIEKVRSLNSKFTLPNSNIFIDNGYTINNQLNTHEPDQQFSTLITDLPPLKFM